MGQDRTNRKLAAIFSTDVAGYSRMMEADEAWTIQNLEENKQLMSSLIEEYKGRVVDSPGDNLLAEFSSVINAVECAVKIQKELNKKNFRLTEEHQMKFRIGVNLGDVVTEDGKIYGNGVNIAARLEGLAEPGGICISGTSYDQVKSKIDVDCDYLGEYEVKNINEPVRVYRILMGGGSTEKYVSHGKSKKLINPISILTAIIILLVIAFGIIIPNLSPELSKPHQVMRFEYELPEDQQFSSSFPQVMLAVSPDGSQFVYTTNRGLYIRSVGKLDADYIKGTDENPKHPFFSPDSKWIGYWTKDNQLKKVPIDGGKPTLLCSTDNAAGADWQLDNTIIFSDLKGIWKIPADGGTPEILIPAKDEITLFPQLLPDGKSLMYSRYSSDTFMVTVYSLESGERKELFPGAISHYLPTGHIVFTNDSILYAIGFDPDTYKTIGGKVPLEEAIYQKNSLTHQYAVSDSGTLVYIPAAETEIFSDNTMVWVNREGVEEPIGADAGVYFHPRVSPDGTKVALSIMDDEYIGCIRIWDFTRKTMIHLTSDEINAFHPIWTPDGKNIIFAFNNANEGSWNLGKIASNGTGEIENIFSSSFTLTFPNSWVDNGQSIVLAESQPIFPLEPDIAILSLDEGPSLKPLLQQEKWNEYQPQISPDNRWIAYTCNESGEDEIYVRPFPNVDEGKVKVSTNGGNSPLWSPDGKELFYRNNDTVMAVSVGKDPINNPGNPQLLFQGEYVPLFINPLGSQVHPWDISSDGRFLMLKQLTSLEVDPRKINIVLNWDEELKEKVPSN